MRYVHLFVVICRQCFSDIGAGAVVGCERVVVSPKSIGNDNAANFSVMLIYSYFQRYFKNSKKFSPEKFPQIVQFVLRILAHNWWEGSARNARKKNTQVELRGINVELRMDFSKYNIKTVL